MKNITYSLTLIIILVFYSCTKPKGIWEDNIHLSTKAVEFNSNGDSVTIKTEGDSWWISDISVDDRWYSGFMDIELQADNYSIIQDCFNVEHRDKKTLIIKVEANPNNVKRIITVGLEAGDYFDRVTITQKPK